MNELALFAGSGGGILGGALLGWRTVCAVEIDSYCRRVLMARQNDGILNPFPIWDDIRTFDGRPWHGIVDVVSGGFPCQDISSAGKGAGIDGDRSGLWREMARIVSEVRPLCVWVENSPMLVRRGLARVLGDLATMGYDARWGIVGADDAGAPHRRKRIWILAHAAHNRIGRRIEQPESCESSRNVANLAKLFKRKSADKTNTKPTCGETRQIPGRGSWWLSEPQLGRVAHGVANRVDRLKALGNGQVPAVVELAWKILS